MSNGVDEPGGMQHEAVAEQTGGVKSHQRLLLPQVDRNCGGKKETEEEYEEEVVSKQLELGKVNIKTNLLLLESQHRVFGQVGEVQFGSEFLQFWVLAHQ